MGNLNDRAEHFSNGARRTGDEGMQRIAAEYWAPPKEGCKPQHVPESGHGPSNTRPFPESGHGPSNTRPFPEPGHAPSNTRPFPGPGHGPRQTHPFPEPGHWPSQTIPTPIEYNIQKIPAVHVPWQLLKPTEHASPLKDNHGDLHNIDSSRKHHVEYNGVHSSTEFSWQKIEKAKRGLGARTY